MRVDVIRACSRSKEIRFPALKLLLLHPYVDFHQRRTRAREEGRNLSLRMEYVDVNSLPRASTPFEDVLDIITSCFRLSLFLLSWTYTASLKLIAFVTLTTPRLVYSILSWSVLFSLRLDITKVVALVLVGTTILSYIYKVRFLNRYTTLKEIPLVKDEGFDLLVHSSLYLHPYVS